MTTQVEVPDTVIAPADLQPTVDQETMNLVAQPQSVETQLDSVNYLERVSDMGNKVVSVASDLLEGAYSVTRRLKSSSSAKAAAMTIAAVGGGAAIPVSSAQANTHGKSTPLTRSYETSSTHLNLTEDREYSSTTTSTKKGAGIVIAKRIGKVQLGQTRAQVIKEIGHPNDNGPSPTVPHAGIFKYINGVDNYMEFGANGRVDALTTFSQDVRTSVGNIGVGSTKSEVFKSYGKQGRMRAGSYVIETMAKNRDTILTIFSFGKNGKVSSVQIQDITEEDRG